MYSRSHSRSPHRTAHSTARGEFRVNVDALARGCLGRDLGLVETADAKVRQIDTCECQLVGFVILAETARTASACREEDVAFGNVVTPLRGDLLAQDVHQIADGKVGGRASTGVDEFLARVEVALDRIGQQLHAVAKIPHCGRDQPLVLPGCAAEEDRNAIPRFARESPRPICLVVSAGIYGSYPFLRCELH